MVMKTTHRNYADESGDFNRLSRFIVENNAHVRRHSTWCLGRFVEWKYGLWGDKLSTPGFWKKNAHLWFDGFGELAGFAISEDGGSEAAIITAEGYRFLFEDILQWAIENWGERGPLSIEITARQALEAKSLERHGFEREASFYRSHFDLTTELVERFPLEEGFSVVDMHSHPDYRAQRILRQNAFEGQDDLSEEEIEELMRRYGYVREGPIYHPQTDVCIMAPDGTFVAGCEALIDAWNAEADIERVCTHSGYRRRGFGRVVIQECLYRLRDIGMQKAYITGYSEAAVGLYSSLGARERTESLIYKQAAERY
jgi:GNAT superfamily N-acetyltransferase